MDTRHVKPRLTYRGWARNGVVQKVVIDLLSVNFPACKLGKNMVRRSHLQYSQGQCPWMRQGLKLLRRSWCRCWWHWPVRMKYKIAGYRQGTGYELRVVGFWGDIRRRGYRWGFDSCMILHVVSLGRQIRCRALTHAPNSMSPSSRWKSDLQKLVSKRKNCKQVCSRSPPMSKILNQEPLPS